MNVSHVKDLLKERSELELNNPKLYDYWTAFTELLSRDIDQTIEFLDSCTEEEIYWLSEVFEDISYKVNSRAFIDCLKRLENKYPNIDLADDIKSAEDCIDENG
ncbi:hypothetical protein MKX50_01615 [Paenibacillus sp. FSL W8-0186]|uniref:Uncharacterized protein n=1 Tax=Paenibacillus woosongensis TaxID=307580 RepID=A0ABQ4MQM5_9BACL|nr:hypothetical protein [Paenibacillus woosongensis]GIP58306.1 hypothetical protein J15TS10_21200 [Paenibacillus woosongensis]